MAISWQEYASNQGNPLGIGTGGPLGFSSWASPPTSTTEAFEQNPFAAAGMIAAEQAYAPAVQASERAAEMAAFNMPGVSTGLGGAYYDPNTGQLSIGLSSPYQQQARYLLGQAGRGLAGGASPLERASTSQAMGAFGALGSFDPMVAAQEQFGRLESLLAPEREQQRQAQEAQLYRQGRLGSTGGALEQAALARAQEQARTQGAMEAYNTALQQQMQLAGLGQQLGAFGTGLGAQQFGQGLQALQAAGQLEQLPLGAFQAGLGLGTAQQQAGAQQGAFMLQPLMAQGRGALDIGMGLTKDFTDFMGGMMGAGGMFGG